MKTLITYSYGLLLGICLTSCLYADSLVLRTGKLVSGKVTEIHEQHVVLDGTFKSQTIDLESIDLIYINLNDKKSPKLNFKTLISGPPKSKR